MNYEYGLLNGPCTYYDRKTSKKFKEGWYKHDKKDSIWQVYDVNHDMLAEIINYSQGYKNGPLRTFHIPSGRIKIETQYTAGMRIGRYHQYYDADSLVKAEGFFSDGEADLTYYDSVTREVYSAGHVENEERSGTWKYYYPGGKLAREVAYIAGTREGKTVKYDIDGNITAIEEYKNDQKNGMTRLFYRGTDKLWLEGEFENDTISGKRFCYYRSGKIKRDEVLNKGIFVSGKCYDEEGIEIKCGPFSYAPLFNGDVMTYIGNNLRYPQDALDAKIEGKVVVSFVITQSGNVTDVEIVKGLDNSCDDEALRLVTQMPPWRPAYLDETPVSYQMTLPIVFWIQED